MWDFIDLCGVIVGLVVMAWIYWRGYAALLDVSRSGRARGLAAVRVAAIGGLWVGALLLVLLAQRLLTGKP